MKTFIFTDKERQTINDYLNGKNVNTNFWRVLVHRIKKYSPGINEDVDLMRKFLTSIGEVSDLGINEN